MSRGLRVIAACFGALGALGLVLMFLGMGLPDRYVETLSVELGYGREKVWNALTEYEKMPRWWPQLKTVEREPRTDGSVVWWNVDAWGRRLALVDTVSDAPKRLVRKIATEENAYAGSWTFELDEQAGKTRMTVTEERYVRAPVIRAVLKYLGGSRKALEDFVQHLEKRLAEAEVEAVTPTAS